MMPNPDTHQSKVKHWQWQILWTKQDSLSWDARTVAVDHRPLLKIFGDRFLNHIFNTRLRNLKEKTLRYHFKMVQKQGF